MRRARLPALRLLFSNPTIRDGVAPSGDPDTYRTFFHDSSVGIRLQKTKYPQERKDRVRADMTWYTRAFFYNPRSISIMEDDGVAY